MQILRPLFALLLLLSTAIPARATHIAGAELFYACTGNNMYNVRLILYRDCDGGQAPFDNPITLFVFDRTTNGVYTTIDIGVPFNTPEIEPENWDACVATPYPLCVEKATYFTQVQLPPNNAGYYFAWARCCRNNIITNLAQPECEGVTFLASVPPANVASCNSMPVFNNSPSIFLCAGQPYYFDYSATDADGDSLVYSISNPYTGLNLSGFGAGNNTNSNCATNRPPVVDLSNLMGPSPYRNVVFSGGHSFLNPFGPGGYVTINQQTGYLEAFPPNLGVYVMAVSVREYRNGVLLSENKRDFQFHVMACNMQGPPPVLSTNTGTLPVNGDTILAEAGRPFCFDFTVTDPVSPSIIQVTPLSTIFGGNGGFPPPYATISVSSNIPPVNGQICWTPGCAYVGSVIPVVLSARDTNDCPNYNIVFDTVWIRILPSPASPPVVTHEFGSLPSSGDTLVLDVQQNFCYEFFVVDTLGGASLQSSHTIYDLSGNLVTQSQVVNTTLVGDTLFGEVCWQTACNAGQTYMLVTRGLDAYQCAPNNTNRDTVYLRIIVPENPAPVLATSTAGNVMSGDTIIAQVFENFCFNFSVDDTSGISDSIGFSFLLQDIAGNLAPGYDPSYFATGTSTHIDGAVCWVPSCENVDQLYRFIVRGIQENDCQITNEDLDTIWVRVTEPIKPVPLISHDLGQGPGNNSLVQVADQDSFCYTFRLQDTVIPTELRYTVGIFLLNGTPYTGTGPILTYSTNSDSLLEGSVCWAVPCDLADTEFMMVMTGRDTFDCRTSSIVHDTVWVRHTESIPPNVNLCNVSVEVGDARISMDWQSVSASDLSGYVIVRRDPNSGVEVQVDTLWDPLASSYSDAGGLDVDAGSYCYAVYAIDRCGRVSATANFACTILLDGYADGYSSQLEWSEFTGWPEGVQEQEIHRSYPELPGAPSQLLVTVSPLTFTHSDATITEPRDCYRVRALAAEGGCGEESWSNEVCFNFPPTLFVPTAFTPNGDGQNDYFTSFGEFEATFHMQVWDRWGKLIFESDSQLPGWYGDFRGQPVAEGVYVYRIVITGYDGQVFERNGSVTLLR